MASKFHLLGKVKEVSKDNLIIKIKRNFKDYDNTYHYDKLLICLPYTINTTITVSEVYSIYGRIEMCTNNKIRLIAEQISATTI